MKTKKHSEVPLKPLKKASRPKTTKLGRELVRGLEQVAAHLRGEIKLKTRVIYVPEDVDVRAIREKSGLSQAEFSERFGFNPRTLQEWEQGRAQPDSAVRAYLKVIETNPEGVRAALNS